MFSLLVGSIFGTRGAHRAIGVGLLAVALFALHGCIFLPDRDADCDKSHSAVDPGKLSTDCRPK